VLIVKCPRWNVVEAKAHIVDAFEFFIGLAGIVRVSKTFEVVHPAFQMLVDPCFARSPFQLFSHCLSLVSGLHM
jgi:hypothetical protein